MNQLSFVEAVDRFGERVVVAVATVADRGLDAGLTRRSASKPRSNLPDEQGIAEDQQSIKRPEANATGGPRNPSGSGEPSSRASTGPKFARQVTRFTTTISAI